MNYVGNRSVFYWLCFTLFYYWLDHFFTNLQMHKRMICCVPKCACFVLARQVNPNFTNCKEFPAATCHTEEVLKFALICIFACGFISEICTCSILEGNATPQRWQLIGKWTVADLKFTNKCRIFTKLCSKIVTLSLQGAYFCILS